MRFASIREFLTYISYDEVKFTNPSSYLNGRLIRAKGKQVISWNPDGSTNRVNRHGANVSYRGKARPGIPAIRLPFPLYTILIRSPT